MATTVNNKRTFAKDIATISTALDGIVEFQSIEFSQILITEHGQSINDLQYVKKNTWYLLLYKPQQSRKYCLCFMA